MIRMIDRTTLKHRLSRYERLVFVDTRSLEEYESGYLRDAVHLPIESLERRARSILPNRGSTLVVYDEGSGIRAREGARLLVTLGYPEVLVLEGGESEWAHEGESVQWHANPAPGMCNPSFPLSPDLD